MISINYIFDEEDWTCEINFDSKDEITDDIAYKILQSASISQECLTYAAEELVQFIDQEKIRKYVAHILFGMQSQSISNGQQTVVPTIFSTYDNIRRNDSGN
jgi:hypothetical protein